LDREEERERASEKRIFQFTPDLADELDPGRRLEQRFDYSVEVRARLRVDLGCHPKRHTGETSNLDAILQSLRRGDTAEEGQGRARTRAECVEVRRHPVISRRLPVGTRDRPTLIVGDRDEWNRGVDIEERFLV